LFPTRLTVSSFMGWLGFDTGLPDARRVFDLMCLGLKHFRLPRETLRVGINVLSDDELRSLQVPVLLLMGDREVIYDPTTALARARRLIPDFQGELVPQSSHDMCFSQHGFVDARVLDFLNASRQAERRLAP